MEIYIESDSHLPVYAQLKEQIKFLILNGELEPGAKLPTTRQLAGFLNINRNTVQKAYQELDQDGFIECRRGRGCEVVERPASIAQPVSAELLAIIDRAIDDAGSLGVEPDQFATIAYARARQRRDVLVRQRIAFIECEPRLTNAVADQIRERLDVDVVPLDISELREPTAEVEERIRDVHLFATTFFHIREVRRLLAQQRKEVVGLMVKPYLEKLIKISQIPDDTPAALVCVSQRGAQDLQESLVNAGIKHLDATLAGVDDHSRLSEAVVGRPVVIASDFVADEVRSLLQPEQELITVDYTVLDDGAINMLRSYID